MLAGLYYGAAKVGFQLEFAGPVAAIVWLPVGIGIAFLFIGGLRFWPGVLIGDLLANNYTALPLGTALGQTCGNMLEVLVAVLLLRRLVREKSPLASVWGVGCMLIAIVVGTAVSATIGAISLRLGGVISTGEIPKVWRTWWLGDATGALVVVPLALAWYRPRARDWRIGRPYEAVLLLATVVALSEIVMSSARPLSYILFPALIWAALRFGLRGGTLAVAITTGLTVWKTTHYLGPFYFHSITRSVLITQLFIGVAALSTLCLAVVVSEREALAARLRASRARLVDATYAERRRIERNLHDGAQQRLTALAYQLHEAGQEMRRAPRPERVAHCGSRGGAPARDRRAAGARARYSSLGLTDVRSREGDPDGSPLARPFRSSSRSCRRDGSPAPAKLPRTTSSSRRSRTRRSTRTPRRFASRCSAVRRRHRGRDRRRRHRRRDGERRLRSRRASRPDRGDGRQVRGRERSRPRHTHFRFDPCGISWRLTTKVIGATLTGEGRAERESSGQTGEESE